MEGSAPVPGAPTPEDIEGAAGRILPSVAPKTIADGLRTSLGELTFPILRALLSAVVTVSEQSIVRAMRLIWERMKLLVEPSAAVPLAALLEGGLSVQGLRVGIILSGGNLDLDSLPWDLPRRPAAQRSGKAQDPAPEPGPPAIDSGQDPGGIRI